MKIARKFAVAGGVAALVLGAGFGGVALADIPDSDDGEFHACVSNGGGQVRLIDKEGGASCHSYETEKTWVGGGSGAPGRQVVSDTESVPANGRAVATVYCPSGKVATGGGWTGPDTGMTGQNTPVWSHWSMPVDDVNGTGWTAKVTNTSGGGPVDLTVYAVCVNE